MAAPVLIEVPGGDGGVLLDIPLLESTLLSPEVLWDCAIVDDHAMVVTSQTANSYNVHLLDNNDIASIEDTCTSGPCDETILNDFPNGSFLSQEEKSYAGYDALFLRSVDPIVTDSLITIHKGIFTTPLGEQYVMVGRIQKLWLTFENETVVTTEFLPMYIILEKDEAADVAASGALAESFNELVKFQIPGKNDGLDPNDLRLESIWPPQDSTGDVGLLPISDAAKACLVARKGCVRRQRQTVQICKTDCSTTKFFISPGCLLCWGLSWWLMPLCSGVCVGIVQIARTTCRTGCWREFVRDTSDCGTDSQVCCILAGGCGDQY